MGERWYMPSRYYTKRVELSSSQHMTMIMLDTNPCISAYRSSSASGWDPCGSEFPTCSPIDEGPCKFNAQILEQDCSAQLAWFQKALNAVPAGDWLVIVGHHPADEMDVEDYTSTMQQHGFDLYLNGHTHTLAQYTIDGSGAYITSGAGSMVKTADQTNDPRCADGANGEDVNQTSGHSYRTIFNQKVAGFTLHKFNADFTTLTNEFVSYQGTVIHSFDVQKGGPSRLFV
eukprot:NODE_2627_length_902_cov_1000.883117.p1 GENE.NODE_2627_length_902_cov_1000.883117~~NODE_2627_length_902_cov_1000.883117.p1  ORF type:complete len:230 (+),score=66.86 NODE_2627_length_902_cov_1000.883117:3-692(+)